MELSFRSVTTDVKMVHNDWTGFTYLTFVVLSQF